MTLFFFFCKEELSSLRHLLMYPFIVSSLSVSVENLELTLLPAALSPASPSLYPEITPLSHREDSASGNLQCLSCLAVHPLGLDHASRFIMWPSLCCFHF